MVIKDKPLGCPHDWHKQDVICGVTHDKIKGLAEQKCCICNAEQFLDDR